MWRSYRKFWRSRTGSDYSTQVHLFPGIHEYPEGGSRTTLCGKKANADYIESMLIGPLEALHYCKKCDKILKGQQQ